MKRLALAVVLASVPGIASAAELSPPYTLYRSSIYDQDARVHFATFNVADGGAGTGRFNQGNCEMVADLLRANLRKLNNGTEPVRFWCEEGEPHNVSN